MTLIGELDLATRPLLDDLIAEVSVDRCELVLDLSRLTFLCAGITQMLGLAKSCSRFALFGAKGSVAHVLALTQVDTIYGRNPDSYRSAVPLLRAVAHGRPGGATCDTGPVAPARPL